MSTTVTLSATVAALVKDCQIWGYSDAHKFARDHMKILKKAGKAMRTPTKNGVVLTKLTDREKDAATEYLRTSPVETPETQHKTTKAPKPKPTPKSTMVDTGHKADDKMPDKAVAKNDHRERDQFGTAIGTKAGAVNACLTTEGKTMAQILEETQSAYTWYEHLNKLCREGKIMRDGKMFRLFTDAERKAADKARKVAAEAEEEAKAELEG